MSSFCGVWSILWYSMISDPQIFMENQYKPDFVLGAGDKGIIGQTMLILLQN